MSLDRRLKADLERDAMLIEPDVERNLEAVEARALGASSVGRLSPTLLLAALGITVLIALRFGFAGPSVGGPSQRPSAQPPAPTGLLPSTSPLSVAIRPDHRGQAPWGSAPFGAPVTAGVTVPHPSLRCFAIAV